MPHKEENIDMDFLRLNDVFLKVVYVDPQRSIT